MPNRLAIQTLSNRLTRCLFVVFTLFITSAAWCQATGTAATATEDGAFVELFDGATLQGWRGRPHLDPRKAAAFSEAERATKQKEWDQDLAAHWSVDAAKEEIVSDGHGVFLTTERQYRDFEFLVDWKMVQPNGDSGIYLRGAPQVQIWDPKNPKAQENGADKGSGALWNNGQGHAGKWPLVLADNPVGQWNTFRIRMIGSRVWVWFNDQLTVDGAVMDNYYDRSLPMFASGVIQLQTHGSETRFRNVRLREIETDEANEVLSRHDAAGFQSIFNGRDFDGWAGPTDKNRIVDGAILSSHGTIYTQQEWKDFGVQFEFLLPDGGNNGLAIRYAGEGDTAYLGMCELQVLDNEHEKYAKLDPRQYHGSAYGMVAAHRGYLRDAGQWNFQRVTVQGSRITVELNGTIILDADLSEINEFMGDNPHPGLHNAQGHFGFAGHGDPVKFRKIEARRL